MADGHAVRSRMRVEIPGGFHLAVHKINDGDRIARFVVKGISGGIYAVPAEIGDVGGSPIGRDGHFVRTKTRWQPYKNLLGRGVNKRQLEIRFANYDEGVSKRSRSRRAHCEQSNERHCISEFFHWITSWLDLAVLLNIARPDRLWLGWTVLRQTVRVNLGFGLSSEETLYCVVFVGCGYGLSA